MALHDIGALVVPIGIGGMVLGWAFDAWQAFWISAVVLVLSITVAVAGARRRG